MSFNRVLEIFYPDPNSLSINWNWSSWRFNFVYFKMKINQDRQSAFLLTHLFIKISAWRSQEPWLRKWDDRTSRYVIWIWHSWVTVASGLTLVLVIDLIQAVWWQLWLIAQKIPWVIYTLCTCVPRSLGDCHLYLESAAARLGTARAFPIRSSTGLLSSLGCPEGAGLPSLSSTVMTEADAADSEFLFSIFGPLPCFWSSSSPTFFEGDFSLKTARSHTVGMGVAGNWALNSSLTIFISTWSLIFSFPWYLFSPLLINHAVILSHRVLKCLVFDP